MSAMLVFPCFLVVLAVAGLSLRRAWLSRTQNWILYCINAGAAINAALAMIAFHDRMPSGGPLLLAAAALVSWWLLRQYSRHRRAMLICGDDQPGY